MLLGDSFHQINISLLVLGLTIFVNGLLADVCTRFLPASQFTISMLTGIIIGPAVLGLVDISKWAPEGDILENAARFVVAIQIVALTLRLPFDYIEKAWKNILFLVFPLMFLTWMTCSFIIYGVTKISNSPHLSIWQSLVVGASISTTDPVLASAVATSRLTQHLVPKRLRYTISAESALNEGVIVLFAEFALLYSENPGGSALRHWVLDVVLYNFGVAVVIAITFGAVVGHLMRWAEPGKLHDKQLIVALTIAFAALIIGGFDLLGINNMIGVTVAGVVYALIVEGKERTSDSLIQETVDLIFTTPLFILLGTALPFHQWGQMLGARNCVILIFSIFFLRRLPWMLLLGRIFLRQQLASWTDTIFIGWFGPIGIGAIYHSFLALRRTGIQEVWIINSLLLFTSVIIFGATDTVLLKAYTTAQPEHRKKMERRQTILNLQLDRGAGNDGQEYEEDLDTDTEEELEEEIEEMEEALESSEAHPLSPPRAFERRRPSMFPQQERYITRRRSNFIDPENDEVIPTVHEHHDLHSRRRSILSNGSRQSSPRVNFDRKLSYFSRSPQGSPVSSVNQDEMQTDDENENNNNYRLRPLRKAVVINSGEDLEQNPHIIEMEERGGNMKEGEFTPQDFPRREFENSPRREIPRESSISPPSEASFYSPSIRRRKSSVAAAYEVPVERSRGEAIVTNYARRMSRPESDAARKKSMSHDVLPPSIFPSRNKTPIFRRQSLFNSLFQPKSRKSSSAPTSPPPNTSDTASESSVNIPTNQLHENINNNNNNNNNFEKKENEESNLPSSSPISTHISSPPQPPPPFLHSPSVRPTLAPSSPISTHISSPISTTHISSPLAPRPPTSPAPQILSSPSSPKNESPL